VHLICDGSNWLIANRRIPSTWSSAVTSTITGSTANPTKGTTTVDQIFWRRVGSSMEIFFEYVQTVAGVAGTGAYLIAIPESLTADTGKLTASTDVARPVLGSAAFFSANGVAGVAKLYDSTHIALSGVDASNNLTAWGSTFGALSGASVIVSFRAMVPISGWKG
jgi:hypothetical protein